MDDPAAPVPVPAAASVAGPVPSAPAPGLVRSAPVPAPSAPASVPTAPAPVPTVPGPSAPDPTAPDPVTTVLTGLRRSRQARRIRRFRHGSHGTSLVDLDGRAVVLKAWPLDAPATRHLPIALRHMETMRRKGVVVPRVLESGELAGHSYVAYERLPGRWPARVTAHLLRQLVGVVDTERGAAPDEGRAWAHALHAMLFTGDPLLDITPSVLEAHPAGRVLLGEARACLQACDPALLTGGDLVHGDFAPENVLVHQGRLCGVIDWEQCRTGDARFDLIGLLFDIELGAKATPTVSAQLRHALRQRLPAPLLALYTAIYAVRYTSWAIGTSMEQEVLDLADRLGRDLFRG